MVSFCTGGIRCEKAALWLRADGMDNVLQLDGGILGYFEQVGGQGYDGRCFVFDDRIALDPALAPLVARMELGSASFRESVGKSVHITVVAVSFKTTKRLTTC